VTIDIVLFEPSMRSKISVASDPRSRQGRAGQGGVGHGEPRARVDRSRYRGSGRGSTSIWTRGSAFWKASSLIAASNAARDGARLGHGTVTVEAQPFDHRSPRI
jgi:hypothetical protein